MVELVKAGGKPSELAKEFGCHDSSISGWVRQADADEPGGGRSDAQLATAEGQELAQLRRQLRQATQESDIWAKAGPSLPINDRIMTERIRPIHAMSDYSYGRAHVQAELRDIGLRVNHKRIERLMKLAHLQGVSR